MNENLLKLYLAKWDKLCSAMHPILLNKTLELKPTCPLLIYIGNEEEYKSAVIRLMIFGQETNSWYSEFHDGIQQILDNYNNFFNEGACWNYGGQFWNGVKGLLNFCKKNIR